MQANWNWGIFFEQAPFGNVTYLNWLIDGFLTTAALFVCAWIVAFIVGSLFGILRTLPHKPLRALGTTYVAIFRLLSSFSSGIWPRLIFCPAISVYGSSLN